MLRPTFFSLLLIFLVKNSHEANESLILVHAIFRHGDRTREAATVYPTDPYINETYFPVGLGQLTNQGKMREYNLGEFLRSRYDDFLGPYNPDILDAWSTDFNRTKMSLELVLAGLFPPTEDEAWSNFLPWQPIPYNYFSSDKPNILQWTDCPYFYAYYAEYLLGEKVAKIDQENRELYQYLSEHSGLPVITYLVAVDIYSALLPESEWGFELPEWTKSVFPEKLTPLAGEFFAGQTASLELKKIVTGGFFQKIIEDTREKLNGSLVPSERKLFLYSAHDSNIAAVLDTLDLFDPPHHPFYGSCVIIEIVEVEDEPFVKVLYKKNTDVEAELLKLPECEELCPLDQFEAIVEKFYSDVCLST